MDEEWAVGVLEWWIKHATKARHSSYSPSTRTTKTLDFGYRDGAQVQELRQREDQTREVIARINGLTSLPVIMRPGSSDVVFLAEGVETARYALGRLRTQAETRARLGTAAPAMLADALHPTIWDAASARWASGHHSDAVQRAATFLNAHIQDLVSRHDVSDSELMREAFSLADPVDGKPRLRWPGADDDLTVKTMRIGVLNFSQGVFSAIRNPATHSTVDMERQEALEHLATLSALARWVDRCDVVRAGA